MELIHILAVQQLTLLNCQWPYGRKLSRLWLQQVMQPGPHISRVVCLWAPEQVFCDVGSQEPQTLHLYHRGPAAVDRSACYFPFMFLGRGKTAFSAIIPYKMTFNKGSRVVQQASQQEDLPGASRSFSLWTLQVLTLSAWVLWIPPPIIVIIIIMNHNIFSDTCACCVKLTWCDLQYFNQSPGSKLVRMNCSFLPLQSYR